MPAIKVSLSTRSAEQAQAPIISRLAKEYNVTVNIKRAQVTDDYGQMELLLDGDLEQVQRAISWLHTTGLNVSASDRSVGVDTDNL